MREDSSGISTIRRKRRKHPTLLRTPSGVEEVVPGLSTWTAEDLLVAGGWDEDLSELADLEVVEPDDREEIHPNW